MTRAALVAAALSLVACSSEECDPGASGPLPAGGCCTADGFCLSPPAYPSECRTFHRSECSPEEYPPRFEGQEPWVACPPLDPDAAFTPCPLSWLLLTA